MAIKYMNVFYIFLLLSLTIYVNGGSDIADKSLRHDIAKTDEVQRVKIKVYRGPVQEKDGERFASFGFWVQQPAGVN